MKFSVIIQYLFLLFLLVDASASADSLFPAPIALMALEGEVDRPYLIYRSLEDERLSGDSTGGLVFTDILGPETYLSWNSTYPHGMNDGILWQGVGMNGLISAGVRLQAFGFSATFKPVLHFSQNSEFEIMPTVFAESKGFGYFWNAGMDFPQRPGEDSIFGYAWGDSELRYTWRNATIGIGTQAVWLGPSKYNAIILSDNAPSFPKLDFGVTKTHTLIGDLEGRAFWGRLQESDYFNSDSSDDYTLLTGLSIAYQPNFFPEFIIGFNRAILSNWADDDWGAMTELLIPIMKGAMGSDQRDQRASLTGELLFPAVGLRIWTEWARNDYTGNNDAIIRYPFHSQGYTLGLERLWKLVGGRYSLLIDAEIANTESSRDYSLWGPYSFYGHHRVPHGYTNEGQILGAGIGSGGNFQHLGARFGYAVGSTTAYVERKNRDNDYIWFLNSDKSIAEVSQLLDRLRFNAELTIGIETEWMLGGFGTINLETAYNMNHNPHYEIGVDQYSVVLDSWFISASFTRNL